MFGLRQSLNQHACAHVGQLVMQAGCGFLFPNQQGLHMQHVTRVQSGIHLHDGDTRL